MNNYIRNLKALQLLQNQCIILIKLLISKIEKNTLKKFIFLLMSIYHKFMFKEKLIA